MRVGFVFNQKRDESLEQAEFDTPDTIAAIASALRSGGHDVFEIEMNFAAPSEWVRQLESCQPDIVFNTAEGLTGAGRESLGPSLFEQMGMPFVGSGPYACFLTLDKSLSKLLVSQRGVSTVEGEFLQSREALQVFARRTAYPVFVKPNFEGSSKGISLRSYCSSEAELLSYGAECLEKFPAGILVERFVSGRDISVPYIAGLGEEGVLEPLDYEYSQANALGIYDYEFKNQLDDAVSVQCPAAIGAEVRGELIRLTKACVSALGLQDFARADFRITPEGKIFFLEMNALPSLQPSAGLFQATALLGLSYKQTLLHILEVAVQRNNLQVGGRNAEADTRNPRIGLVYNLKRKESEAEFDSQETIDALIAAVGEARFPIVPIEATTQLAESLKAARVDIVFNIAEGTRGRSREAQVPAICDLLGIEHTGSDATCLALSLDKALTKKLLLQDGLPTPAYRIYQGEMPVKAGLRFPVIAKPNAEGASIGIRRECVATHNEELERIVKGLWTAFRAPILCEEYIQGREFTVGVLEVDGVLETLGPLEIVFQKGAGPLPVYCGDAKTEAMEDSFLCNVACPVLLGAELDRQIHSLAKQTFRTLGCRDVARVDFRLSDKGEWFILEINPLPGLAPDYSDLVVLAKAAGKDYSQLIQQILSPALRRWRDNI